MCLEQRLRCWNDGCLVQADRRFSICQSLSFAGRVAGDATARIDVAHEAVVGLLIEELKRRVHERLARPLEIDIDEVMLDLIALVKQYLDGGGEGVRPRGREVLMPQDARFLAA